MFDADREHAAFMKPTAPFTCEQEIVRVRSTPCCLGGVGVLVGIFILLRDDGRFFCVEIDATCIWMHATTAMKRAAALARLHEDPTVETKLRHFGSASSSGVTGTHRRRAGKRCGPMFCILKCAPGKRKMAFKLQHRHLIKPALPQI